MRLEGVKRGAKTLYKIPNAGQVSTFFRRVVWPIDVCTWPQFIHYRMDIIWVANQFGLKL